MAGTKTEITFRDYHIVFEARKDFNNKLTIHFKELSKINENKKETTPLENPDQETNRHSPAVVSNKIIPQASIKDNVISVKDIGISLEGTVFEKTIKDISGQPVYSVDEIIQILDNAALDIGAKQVYRDKNKYKDYKVLEGDDFGGY